MKKQKVFKTTLGGYFYAQKQEIQSRVKDNRGRTKPMEEMTEIEKLKAEMKILEAKNRQLEIENEFIKKFQELIGGGH